jgi:hypothetical protein
VTSDVLTLEDISDTVACSTRDEAKQAIGMGVRTDAIAVQL